MGEGRRLEGGVSRSEREGGAEVRRGMGRLDELLAAGANIWEYMPIYALIFLCTAAAPCASVYTNTDAKGAAAVHESQGNLEREIILGVKAPQVLKQACKQACTEEEREFGRRRDRQQVTLCCPPPPTHL